MLYFAYGSNMSSPRLRQRRITAKVIGVGRLDRYRLRFHKVSKDGSGKCDIEEEASPEAAVIGVVFEIASVDKQKLDKCEGLGFGYTEEEIDVRVKPFGLKRVFTYVATDTDRNLKPFDWYLGHVLYGAREHGFPPEYVACIEAAETLADANMDRRNLEMSIYD